MTDNGFLTCDSFEDRVNELLDQRKTIADDNLLLKHSSRCDDCDQLLNEFVVFQNPTGFSDSISEDASHVRSRYRFQILSRWTPMVAAVAAMVVLFVGVFDRQDTPDSKHVHAIGSIATTPASTMLMANDRSSFLSEIQPKIFDSVDGLVEWMPDFSVADKLPNLLPPIPTWQAISDGLDPLGPILVYSYEIPGVRSARCTVDVTINWLRDSLSKPQTTVEPEIGLEKAISLSTTA